LRLGVLASGGGTNLQAIIDACEQGGIPARVVIVISNNSRAGALERARRHGIPTRHLSNYHFQDDAELDAALAGALRDCSVDLVLFAGYMKRRGSAFLEAFPGRILNIHPALLPKFGGRGMYGMHVHRAVLEAGETISGVTVHVVDEHYDHGPILAQEEVPVLPGDTPETLAARVLEVEHRIYPDVIRRIARGEITLPTP
jgi:phosphoribosylglycinamide formyltransferase-1